MVPFFMCATHDQRNVESPPLQPPTSLTQTNLTPSTSTPSSHCSLCCLISASALAQTRAEMPPHVARPGPL